MLRAHHIDLASRIDIANAFAVEPPPLLFVFSGFLRNTVGTFVSPGGRGKSIFALECAMGVACSLKSGDLLGLQPQLHGAVTYLAAEDGKEVLESRIHSIGTHLSPEARAEISENLTLITMVGALCNLFEDQYLETMIASCAEQVLIVIDTISRMHAGDENSNGEMAELVTRLEYLSKYTGAAVLYLHHANKAAGREEQGDQQHAARGASALVDNARWAGYIVGMSPKEAQQFSIDEDDRSKFIRYGVSKHNYSAHPMDRWFKRHEGGVLLPADFLNTNGWDDAKARTDREAWGRRYV